MTDIKGKEGLSASVAGIYNNVYRKVLENKLIERIGAYVLKILSEPNSRWKQIQGLISTLLSYGTMAEWIKVLS